MQQRFPCPKCGVPVEYGARFCGNCGNTMNWGAPPPYPQQPPQQPPYGYQNPQQWGQQPPPYNQPGWGQQTLWGQPGRNQPPPPYGQPPMPGHPPQFQQQNMAGARRDIGQQKSSNNMIIFLIVLIVVVFTIGGFAIATNGFSSTNKPTTTTETTTPPVTQKTSPTTTNNTTQTATPPATSNLPASQYTKITADELITAYANDANGSRTKYEGNRWAISGKVSGVNSSAPPFIYMKGSQGSPLELQFSFSQGQEANVSDRNIGDSISVEGKIVNFLGTVIIVDDCKFVK